MPIRPDQRRRYPRDWPAISRAIRGRAEDRCECRGECGSEECGGRCPALNGERHPLTGSRVVLTVAHLDHTPENCQASNLRAMCQRCHNRLDAPMRRAGRLARRRARLAAGELV